MLLDRFPSPSIEKEEMITMKREIVDEWGRDPSVQKMRAVYQAMEEAQAGFFEKLHISRFDQRMRHWRRQARAIFERAWAESNRRGTPMTSHRLANLYLHCLADPVLKSGVKMKEEILPADPDLQLLVNRVAP
jgi:hypothetical protein